MLLFLFRILASVPLSVLHTIGRLAGRVVYALPGKYRERLQANARQAGYDSPAFARKAAAEAGAMIMELPKVWLRSEESLSKVVSDDLAVVQAALAEDKGIMFITPHLGCFEITSLFLTQFGPITVMFRPPRKAILAPVMEIARNRSGQKAVPANTQGVREIFRALKRGEAVGMVPDQAPAEGDGVWSPFFGRPAYTMTLTGKLAAQTKAAVVAMAGERLPGGKGWRIHYVRLPDPFPTDPVEQALLINQAMEDMIRRFPEQYLWSYKRYKVPKGAPPPPDAESSPKPSL